MVADIVKIVVLLCTVLLPAEDAADVRLPLRPWAKARRIGQDGLQELERDDLLPLKVNRLDRGHADILEAAQMRQIALAKRHKEANAPDPLDVLREGLQLLVMEEVHILFADFGEVVDALDLHRLRLDPRTVLPIAAVCRYLADVDLRIEIRRKGVAMVAAVAVEDVDIVDLVEFMLHRIGTENARHPGVKARPEESR